MDNTVEEGPTTAEVWARKKLPLLTWSEIMSAFIVYIIATVLFFFMLGFQNIVDFSA